LAIPDTIESRDSLMENETAVLMTSTNLHVIINSLAS
jgi:hypothetical protein